MRKRQQGGVDSNGRGELESKSEEAAVDEKMKNLNSLIFGPDFKKSSAQKQPESVNAIGISSYWFNKCLGPLFDVDEGADARVKDALIKEAGLIISRFDTKKQV